MAASSSDYADGSVHELTQGRTELAAILAGANTRGQVGSSRGSGVRGWGGVDGCHHSHALQVAPIIPPFLLPPQLVLVDYSASWCGPCRMMLPVLQQFAREWRGKLAVIKVRPPYSPL